ncbi:hypothetical protein FP2506_11317 [Fulvimarina pelagi HTCC2506]|uniref:Uncharacterized protein n=1 Tax=Fulvimarina pelagi HTCC2506 TaxID=314231 RepID=Q0FZ16_9HYPH|nr:hypothetical protein [Fulvimarina pelagi]EAU40142.1 hypothetical protein FP2506_11317 [Fulvimarina pelagi HTCC2506]
MAVRPNCRIGKATLKVIGLNPESFSTEAEGRWPGAATWTGMDYQATGVGEERAVIRARTAPHLVGGLDALAWLKIHLKENRPVNFIRLGANYAGRNMGQIGVRFLSYDETKLHPHDGVGRILDVEIDLVMFGNRT